MNIYSEMEKDMKVNKRLLAVISLLAVLLVIVSGCGKKADNSVKKIQDKGTLVVGTEAEFAPFEFPIIKNGQKVITGYDMYIAKAIADDMGVKLKIVNTTFSSLIPDLKENKIDLVLAGMTATPERRKSVAFSNGYYKVENWLLVQKGNADKYAKISDTNKAQIGVQQASLQQTIAKSKLKANLVTESNVNSLTTELGQGKLAGVILDSVVAENFVKQNPDKYEVAKVKLPTPKSQQDISVAARKDDKKLVTRVNKVIKQLKSSGKLDQLYKKAEDKQAELNK